ncbi:MAG: acyl-CoA dehydrogenase family protein, partial [Gammaproteobacteria bacterium]
MSLVHTDDERMLLDSARDFLRANSPVSALRALRDSGDTVGFSRELWSQMAGMGWSGLLVPEANGGLGFSHAGAGIVCEQMGRTLCASPFLSTAVFGTTLIAAAGSEGQRSSILPRVAAGSCLVAVAFEESPRHDPLAIAASAEPDGAGGYLLRGEKRFVLEAHVARVLVVAARIHGASGEADGISLFLVDPREEGLSITRESMVDSRNAATVHLDGVRVGSAALLGPLHGGYPALERAL